jgi:hypothetical protein
MTVLDLPEGPTHKELAKQARDYVKHLSPEDYTKLKEEALSEKGDYNDDYVDKLDLFKQMLFTPRECQAYAGMRIDSPGVRRVIARRALLAAVRGWNRIPEGMLPSDVTMMEDAFLKHDNGTPLTDGEVMGELQRIRRQRR